MNLRKNLQAKFQIEKLGEQVLYQENVKKLRPLSHNIKVIASALAPSVSAPLGPSGSSALPPLPPLAVLKLGNLSHKYLKKLGLKEYDHAFDLMPIEGSIDFELGMETAKIEGNDLIINGKKYVLWRLITLMIIRTRLTS